MADKLTRSHITKNPYDDPGDMYDPQKWDFPTNDLVIFYVDHYPYKINDTGSDNKNRYQVNKLVKIRSAINKLCDNVYNYLNKQKNIDTEVAEGLLLFLDIHATFGRDSDDSIYYTDNFNKKLENNDYISSKYLLSELPLSNRVAMQFVGLDVPKLRFVDENAPFIGPDKNIRCAYRDIHISNKLTGSALKKLMLHELSHTVCSHQLYRPDDHPKEFKDAEKILTKLSKNISF
jgi:hypothetical protein